MIKIINVEPDSHAEKNGLKAGDYIISINDKEINDVLDCNFYSVNERIKLKYLRNSSEKEVEIFINYENLGIEPEDFKIKHCGNRCVFCFVDQNPEGMRDTLYIKDEDYRYSFMYGSYFTLTTITRKELDRIIDQRLSPLYVSVHAVDKNIRKKLLGINRDDEFLDKLKFLVNNGIQVHTQIVLCPGINDGSVLKETIETMYSLFPGVCSLAVVPIGLTKYRNGLFRLKLFNKEEAGKVIDLTESYHKRFLEETGTRFVFPSDEFFIKAKRDIPDSDYYEEFEQYQDGVGMVRSYIDDLVNADSLFPGKIDRELSVALVTGKSFSEILKLFKDRLNRITGINAEIIEAENQTFGETVTVAGLLGGKDIIREYQKKGIKSDVIVLPDTCINHEGIFIDNLTLNDIESRTGCKVIIFENFENTISVLSSF